MRTGWEHRAGVRKETSRSVESAFEQLESQVDAALKTARDTLSSLRKLLKAAQLGVARDLPKCLRAAGDTVERLKRELDEAQEHGDFDISEGSYLSELVEQARRTNLQMHSFEDRVYCYPSLLRIAPGERAIFIDRRRDTRLRPSVVVKHLKALQNKPPRFNSRSFLNSLRKAYHKVLKSKKRSKHADGDVVPLWEVYDLFTLLPGQAKEYSKHEFARDLYLLDLDAAQTDPGFSLHTARGNEPESRIFSIVTREGEMKRYYGVSFRPSE